MDSLQRHEHHGAGGGERRRGRGGSPGSLTAAELELIGKVREVYRARMAVDCTACRYCLPCPSGINIPAVLASLNNASSFGNPAAGKAEYQFLVGFNLTAGASECTRCGRCEETCPQHVPVADELEEAARLFE